MTDADPAAEQPPSTTKRRIVPVAAIALVAILALAVVAVTTLVTNHPDGQAVQACESWVVNDPSHIHIDVPVTAKFFDENAYLDGSHPEVKGRVDLRGPRHEQMHADFICRMAGGDGKWTVAFGYVLYPGVSF